MYVLRPIRLLSLTALSAFCAWGVTPLPVVFEQGLRPGEFLARVGSSAVVVRSTGVQFEAEVDLLMVGARVVAGEALGRLPGTSNYFQGSDRAKWRPGVPHFGRLVFRGVYPGIDVVYYGRDGKLEYDFVAGAGADLSRVQLVFAKSYRWASFSLRGASAPPDLAGRAALEVREHGGAEAPRKLKLAQRWQGAPRARLTAQGDLRLGDILQHRPRVFQDGRELTSRYRLTGQTASIEIDGLDSTRAFMIDPVIESATYLGGGSYEAAKALKLDAQGNVYLAGQAPSPGAFSGPFPSSNNPGVDVALIKFSPQSNTIAYYVFLGGDQDDIVNSLAIDSTGAAYLAGSTRSTNFPVSNGFQMSPGSAAFPDAFVAKIAPDGKSIAYSTYLGGSGSDEAFAIAVDATGAAYVGGGTGSRNFPVQAGALQPAFGGSILNQSATGFLAVINPAGNKIAYATLLGGSRQEQVRAIALDTAGNVYAGGNTSSLDFPIRGGGVQSALPGLVSGFVAKVAPDLSQMFYSTYIGGRSTTSVNALVVDPQGSAIAAGYTSSTDFPVKLAPQDRYGGGDRDAFVARLTPQGNDYAFATYLGGSDVETINDLTLEANGMLTVVGATASADFPQRNGLQAFQGKAPNQDAFAAKFLNNSLIFSTLIGGTGDDQAFGVQADSTGATFIAGVTSSTDFPVKGTAYQGQFGGGGGDMFLVKLSADPILTGSIPSLNASPSVLNFVASQGGGVPPAAALVAVTAINGGVTFTVDWTGGSWLSCSPARSDSPATVNVFANQAGLASGVYTGTVRLTPTNGTAPAIINVTLTVANPAPALLSINPPHVPAGSPDTEFTLSGSAFSANSTVQVSLDDGSLAQTITPSFATDSVLKFTIAKALLFRDALLQLRVKDPGSPAVSNTITVPVGDRFPTLTSVANTASGGGDAIAPGEYVTIVGSSLGPSLPLRVLVGDGGLASTLLGGVRVWFDGIASPLLSVLDHKVVAVVPWSLAGKQTTQLAVEYLGVRSNPVNMPVTSAAPAIFTADGSGTGRGLIFNDSGLSNAGFLPAAKGSVISLYFTGGGVMSPSGVDGKISGSAGSGPVLPVSITIDGVACDLVSIGNALGEVSGMVQASVRVPLGVRGGASVPIQISVGGVTSQPGVVVAIQ